MYEVSPQHHNPLVSGFEPKHQSQQRQKGDGCVFTPNKISPKASTNHPPAVAPPAPPPQATTTTVPSIAQAKSAHAGPFNYVGYLLESFVCSNGIKDHLNEEVMNSPDKMMRVGLALIDTLVSPSNRVAVRQARELPHAEYKFFHDRDLSAEEIRKVVPRYWLSLFAITPPEFRLGKYLVRLTNNLRCDIDCFVMALCLMRRVVKTNEFPVCSRSIHRLFLAASVVAAKMRDDKYYPTHFYATVGGVKKPDIEAMEVSLLNVLEFDAGVSTLEYLDMLYSLRVHCAGLAFAQGQGWAESAWVELVSAVRYPVREQFISEIAALTSHGAYSYRTAFTRDLPMPIDRGLNKVRKASLPTFGEAVAQAQTHILHGINESTTIYPNAVPGVDVRAVCGIRTYVHDTPMHSTSDGSVCRPRAGAFNQSCANVTELQADSVSVMPVRYQHFPASSSPTSGAAKGAYQRQRQQGSPSNRGASVSVSVNNATDPATRSSTAIILSTSSTSPNKTSGQENPFGYVNTAGGNDGGVVRVGDGKSSTGAQFGPNPGDSISTTFGCLGSAVLGSTPHNSIGDITSMPLFKMLASPSPQLESPNNSNMGQGNDGGADYRETSQQNVISSGTGIVP